MGVKSKTKTMHKPSILDTIPTLQGAAGFTLLNVMPNLDPSAIAQIIIVLVTTITQLITLFKKKL